MTICGGTPTFITYSLQNTPLDRKYSVNDLGVLIPNVNKGMSVLGFIKRWSKEFDPYTTNFLFTSLVRPILEYCTSV